MSGANFLSTIEDIVTGDGFYRDVPINLREAFLHSDGATLTTTLTTNPGFAMVNTNTLVLSWAAAKVVKAGLQFQVPGDYDESLDVLSVWVKAGCSDAPTVTVEAFVDSAATTDLAPDAISALTTAYAWREINLDGNGLLANDIVTLTFVPGTHAAAAVNFSAVKMRYRGDLAIFDLDERSSGTPA